MYTVQVVKFLMLRSNVEKKKQVFIIKKLEFLLSNLLMIVFPPKLHTLLYQSSITFFTITFSVFKVLNIIACREELKAI